MLFQSVSTKISLICSIIIVCFMYTSSSSTSAGHAEIDHSPPPAFQERSRKKKKLACENIEVDKALLSSLNNLQRDQSEDEAGSFGEHVVSSLRRFTNRQRAIACIEINKLLFKIEFPNDPYFNPHPAVIQLYVEHLISHIIIINIILDLL